MAKQSSIQTNNKRLKLVNKYKSKRLRLKKICSDKTLSMEERFEAQLRLAECPRNGAKVRLRNRCKITGRPRGFYRKFEMSRIALREHALAGLIPGMVKSSW